jgi:hypothetical protein
VATIVFLGLGRTGSAQTIPAIKAKTLDDIEMVLPKPGSQQPIILVLGFSHKSSEPCAPWGLRLAADFRNDARVSYYQIAVLQDAPSFVRGLIVRGMRDHTPAAERSHFIPIYDHEADWKKLVGFSGEDDAYVVLADAQGRVVWQTHGAVSDSTYNELKSSVAKQLANSATASPAATQ